MQQAANAGKSLRIEACGGQYDRIPVKTHVITEADRVEDILTKYVKPILKDGDIVFMSEKAVACTQKRAVRMKDIHPRPLAVFLSRFVYKTPYGIGLGIPETMEMALRECGTAKILFAAFVSVIGKLLGRRGWFYKIAGDKARSIDGPCDYTLPPYNEYVVLGPLDPEKAAREAAGKSGVPLFAIVDLNDLGGNILGASDPSLDSEKLLEILRDNPLGQSSEQTPIGIIRKAEAREEAQNGIRGWLLKNLDNMERDLRRLVAIPSAADRASPIKPYGQPCRDVLRVMLDLCAENGLAAQNHGDYCGTAVLQGTGDQEIGLWTHLDVVPASGEWLYPPFEGRVAEGFMIGRGVADDKSAAIAGLYIMKYFKENRIALKSSLSTFFGCCEEDGMDDIGHYIKNRNLPDYSVVMDGEFPVSYGEKGIITANFVSPPLSGGFLELSGGLAGNMVADQAYARMKSTPELLERLSGAEGVARLDGSVEVRVTGKAAHAAFPEDSVNAIDLLAKRLLDTGCLSGADTGVFEFLTKVCGDYTGKPLCINASHEEYGALTCVGGMASLKDGRAVLSVNIRYPYSEKGSDIITKLNASCKAAGFALEDVTDSPPNLVPLDSDFVRTLSAAFEAVTGERLPAYIMSGGTYARKLPNAVCFGHMFPAFMRKAPNLPEGHGMMHGPDEALNLQEFVTAMEIYIRAITELDGQI